MRLSVLLLAVFSAFPAYAGEACLPPECTEFPKDAGFINVRDYGAKGDGKTDDTAAINAALAASGGDTGPTFWHDRIVYFPGGTYVVSAPLVKRYAEERFASGAILVGQGRERTIIRLKDNAEGYGDQEQPKPVILSVAKLLDGNATSGGKDYTNKGEGNDAFMNFVENMTVDVGKGNPGAVGIDYLANNLGAIRNVTVRAEGENGATGIALTRKWPGPLLIKNVTVQGFGVGIDVDHTEYGITLDDIRLESPRHIGLRNAHNAVSAHNLHIEGAPLAITNTQPDGLVVITGGKLLSAGTAGQAIRNNGFLNVRMLGIRGYASVLGRETTLLDGVYNGEERLADARQFWSLPVEDAPPPAADPISAWKSVAAFGAKPDSDEDATQAIRDAFASGASTIYFPHGTYKVTANIHVPASVQRIVGMVSTIQPHDNRPAHFRRDRGIFIANNSAKSLTIERLAFDNSYKGDQVAVEASGTQPLVLRDIIGAGVTTMLRPVGGGKVFIENTCCGLLDMTGKEGVWVRQLDTEGHGVRIRNRGAPLWVLGIKAEHHATVVENTGGARTEVLGGLLYITGSGVVDTAIPAFRNVDSRLLVSYVEEAFAEKHTYSVHFSDTQGGETQETKARDLPRRTIGRMAPQIVSRQ